MSDLNNLYQDQILGFARLARQMKPIDNPDASATALNPSCGDQVDVDLKLQNGVITEISATAKGCAICEASTGFAVNALDQMDQEIALGLPQKIENYLSEKADMPLKDGEAFDAIRAFKSRHNCVLLIYQAVAKALTNKRITK